MVAGISKRQQFRNERALQDLIRSVPGNDRCADCQALNPGWASWNIGIFICMRCASLHRKLGTHISKVKSLSMDTWTDDQVDNMKSHGNNIMNKIYNPKNVKPPVPTDVDESDACMERFIRQKYQHRSLDEAKQKPPSRHDSGYDRPRAEDRSPEGSPPPLPPKPARPFGFGLRSASSATNLNRMSNRGSAISPQSDSFGASGISVRKGSGDASFDAKLATLRDMGFANERRNAIALRELEGNLDKTIETLVRLGEGNGSVSLAKSPAAQPTPDAGKSSNPFDQLDARPATRQASGSYNPFDAPVQSQPQAQQAPVQSLEQSFQNLQVAQPLFPHSTGGYPMRQVSLPQPLYQQTATPPVPTNFAQNAYVSSPQPLDGGNNPFFQTGAQPQASMTPPASNLAQTNPFFNQVAPQPTGMQQPPQSQAASNSPFGPLRHANTMPVMPSSSPFGQPSPFQSQLQSQPQSQPQPQAQPQPQYQMQQHLQQPQGSLNPYQAMTAPATPQNAGYLAQPQYGYQASAQHLAPQPTGRVDKNSILSLYQFSPQPSATPEQSQYRPSTAVNPPTQTGQPSPFNTMPQQQQQQSQPFNAMPQQQQQQQQQPQQQQSNPLTDPLSASGTRNPFFTTAPQPGAPAPVPTTTAQATTTPYLTTTVPPQQQQQQQQQQTLNVYGGMPNKPTGFPRGHMSQQSVDINGFQSGRHSPDAFASLSARYG
ncbi:putative GTPase activating protein for Arf [Aspergillus vadensis CBS 113365]|uniref:GTPase activating protein for Arf n=1 Tax=Aspergillus vadensis (strain CBS 113365 / IMI 142717 / IBT 24658) TaxID=1448311 RepID=A0A319BMR4_ASPVC|nr:GTPase activating protein for Arf [Aspergillus vadensis CBS 113365]PYH73651.1 GTPase activating protein for Arf [Aspergillus vadensis CBS 113365]